MFGPKLGYWDVSSKTDPRWDKSGEDYGLVSEGGPPRMKEWLKECKEKFGEIPEDLIASFHKY